MTSSAFTTIQLVFRIFILMGLLASFILDYKKFQIQAHMIEVQQRTIGYQEETIKALYDTIERSKRNHAN